MPHYEKLMRWLPAAVMLVILTTSIVFYFALESKQNQDVAQTVKAGADSVKNQISVRMDARVRSLVRMARRWEKSGTPSGAVWEDDAMAYIHDVPDVLAVERVKPTGYIIWDVMEAGIRTKIDLSIDRHPQCQAAMAQAQSQMQPVMTGITTVFPGRLGFVLYTPIVVDKQFNGFQTAVFNAQDCLDHYLQPGIAEGEAISISENGKTFFKRGAADAPMRSDWVVQDKLTLYGATWDIRVWPTRALAAHMDSRLPGIVFCAGILGSLLLGAVFFLAQRFLAQATATERANAALQAALDEVKTLEGLLPICACCKRVRDDTGYWNQIDSYLHKHTRASFSHGYCPECAAKVCKELGFDIPESVQSALDAGQVEYGPNVESPAAT